MNPGYRAFLLCGLLGIFLLCACGMNEISGSVTPAETEAASPGVSAVPTDLDELPNAISPLPSGIDLNHLESCTVAVSLNAGDAFVDDTGAMRMNVTVYTYDQYDMADIAALKLGDTISIHERNVEIAALDRSSSGTVRINGGPEQGGYELRTDDNGVFFEVLENDAKFWQELGKASLRVSPDFIYTDTSNPDKGEFIYYPGDFLTSNAGIDYRFSPNSTSIVIENGLVIAMNRIYVP